MTDTNDWVEETLNMLDNAEVVNLFTETVWVCVDRRDWDRYIKSKEKEYEVA